MFETFNKARTHCPIVFYEEKTAVFQMKKKSQIDVENDKKPKMTQFLEF